MDITPIAYIHTDFQEKFGIPRQSGLADTQAEIVFAPAYASAEAVRGIEGYSHLWLIWGFSANRQGDWHPTVRPPRLGGNTRVGVFASRSPFRPNPLGLSCVHLTRVELRKGAGPVLHVTGADLLNGTPIYDIKPYLPLADCRTEATGGFTDRRPWRRLAVVIPAAQEAALLSAGFTPEDLGALRAVLAEDPRPAYQDDESRVYGMKYRGLNIRFRVSGDTLTVAGLS